MFKLHERSSVVDVPSAEVAVAPSQPSAVRKDGTSPEIAREEQQSTEEQGTVGRYFVQDSVRDDGTQAEPVIIYDAEQSTTSHSLGKGHGFIYGDERSVSESFVCADFSESVNMGSIFSRATRWLKGLFSFGSKKKVSKGVVGSVVSSEHDEKALVRERLFAEITKRMEEREAKMQAALSGTPYTNSTRENDGEDSAR